MHEANPIVDLNPEVIEAESFESALGGLIIKSEKQELGEFKVGDRVRFERVNALPFGHLDFFSLVGDEELELEIIGISEEDKLIVKWTAADAFIEQCSVEELNASRA